MGDDGPGAVSDAERWAAAFGRITPEMVRATFDQWTVWESGPHWYARRAGTVSDRYALLVLNFVSASSLEGLADQLGMQEWLRARSDAELDAVWRHGFEAVPPDGDTLR